MHRFTALWTVVVILVYSCIESASVAGVEEPDQAATEMLRLGLRGVYFVPNRGQWSDADVHFGLRSRGLDVAFRESSFTMHLRREKGAGIENLVETASDAVESPAEYESLTLDVTFPGANPVLPQGASPQAARFNYFVGGEGRGTASDVPSFGTVVYENLYDGIDLHVMGSAEGVLKYEFQVEPGSDYAQIRIAYDGIESLCIDDGGDLRIETSFGTLSDAAPVVWQPVEDSRATIPARFELCDARSYRIVLDGPVDPTRELVVDPDVVWMYYYGGSDNDVCFDMTIDTQDCIVATGMTASLDFGGRRNSHAGNGNDVFALKTDRFGDLLWMSYLGGNGLIESGQSVAIDGSGSVLIGGETYSTDFGGRTSWSSAASTNYRNHGRVDAFAAKLGSNGAFQWVSYLGGVSSDRGTGIAVNSADHVIVTGETASTDFEGRGNTYRGDQDAFIVELDPSGTLVWMSYLGGTASDNGRNVTVDSSDAILVVGWTDSTDFDGAINSHHGGTQYLDEAFVSKLGPGGGVLWSLYMGGTRSEAARCISTDANNYIVVGGDTLSPDFEGQINTHFYNRDAFVARLAPDGELLWMRHLGGDGDWEFAEDVAIDLSGSLLVVGRTNASDFEGRTNQPFRHDNAFIVRVGATGELDWMTYLGGSGDEAAHGVALIGTSAVVAGYTHSLDFEGRQNSNVGDSRDMFVLTIPIADGALLSAAGTCPGGGLLQVEWSGATSGGQIALVFGRSEGQFEIPNGLPCAGTILGLAGEGIQLAYQGDGGPDGSRTLNASAGPGACGGYLQLLDLTTCGTSNVVRIE